MAVEIERKFLVCGDYKSSARESSHIVQGYLNMDKDRTVRVRVRDDKGYMTVKGPTNGVSRFEWEREIPREEAAGLLALCPAVIDKTRHLVDYGGHTFEVDEFHGDNQGLVVAEVELKSVDETFEKPSWLGLEVTGDHRYYNSALTENPFRNWK